MSADNLNKIAQDSKQMVDLLALVERQNLIETQIKEFKDLLKDVKTNYTVMGITDKEFKDLCLYINKPELLYSDLATKEQYISFVENDINLPINTGIYLVNDDGFELLEEDDIT